MLACKRPEPRQGVLEIQAYVPGAYTAPREKRVFKLSSNETPLGSSPEAVRAYQAIGVELAAYPEGSATELRGAIARVHGVDPERIVCGAGSDELLNLLALAFLGPGDEAIHTVRGFLAYRIATLRAGGRPIAVPEIDYTADVDAILRAVTLRTKIVYLANPNNPTGTYLPLDEVTRLRQNLPAQVLLVLDAAYSEYVGCSDYGWGIELAATGDNVVVCRTFSKIYGLAALRLGWLYGPSHVVDVLNRIRGPFNDSQPAAAAGVAAVADTAHVAAAAKHNAQWLPWLMREIRGLGLTVTPSVGNFLLIHFPVSPIHAAGEADAFLRLHGLILRRLEAYGLPNALRLSVGTEEANRRVVASLRVFLARAA